MRPFGFESSNNWKNAGMCSCGASSLVTMEEYPNAGYCGSCAKKRANFVNKIIGDIPRSSLNIRSLEQMRKFVLRESLFRVVHRHFELHHNHSDGINFYEEFEEPYKNPEFINHCLTEKIIFTERLIPELSPQIAFCGCRAQRQLIEYLDELEKMIDMDYDDMHEFTARIYPNHPPHTRKFPGRESLVDVFGLNNGK